MGARDQRWLALRGALLRRLGEIAPVRARSIALRLGLGVIAPQVLYYSGLSRGLAAEAIVAAMAWTLAIAVYDWRRSSLDPFILYAVAVTAGQGAAALLAGNPAVFAGTSVTENLLDGVGFLGSIAVGRPLLAVAMTTLRRLQADAVVLPAATPSALRRLTLLWALGFLLRGGALYAALISLPLASFLVVNSFAGWPVTGLGVVASLAYLRGRHAGRDNVKLRKAVNPDRERTKHLGTGKITVVTARSTFVAQPFGPIIRTQSVRH